MRERAWREQTVKELNQARESLEAEVRSTKRQLRALGPEDASDSGLVRRQREALRRRRVSLLLKIDQLTGQIQSGAELHGVPRGSHLKGGVRSVVQGGLPGSGKRR